MNEKAKKRNSFRLKFSTIRSQNRVISILLFVIVNLVGIIYPIFSIFNYELDKFNGSPSMDNGRIFTFTLIFIPISIVSLYYLIHSLDKKPLRIFLISILCLGIVDRIFLEIGYPEIEGMADWEYFKRSFFIGIFARYYIFLVVYFIFGLIFIFFRSADGERVTGKEPLPNNEEIVSNDL